MAEVARLFVAVVHRHPMREMEEVLAVAERGLAGCVHGRAGSKRQVLLMDLETLEEMGIPAGAIKENLTTRGLRLQGLKGGQHLRVGEALLQVTIRCDPCYRMDELRLGLQQELRGRRGILCRVVEGGRIRRGDRIEIFDGASPEAESQERGHGKE